MQKTGSRLLGKPKVECEIVFEGWRNFDKNNEEQTGLGLLVDSKGKFGQTAESLKFKSMELDKQ
jgi:hypothetical protein